MPKHSPKDVSSSKLVPISLITIMFLGFAAILFQSYFSSDSEGKIIFKGPPDIPPGQTKKNITPTTGDYKFLPIADTFAYSTSPTSNYGTRASLEVDGDPIKIIYMKFDLNDLSGEIVSSAKLYLHIIDSSGSSQTVKKVTDTSWGETTLTYNIRPALGADVKTINGGSAGNWIEIDVTQAVSEKAGQLLSLGFDSSGADGLDFNSREALSNLPQLIVNTGTTTPAQCADGIDNDADTFIDYPNDLGCSSATDNDETDPVPTTQCNDGVDNDNDAKIDFGTATTNDNGCSSATDTTETSTAVCDNGIDEATDADSLADYRLSGGDPGCVNITDTSEISGLCDDKLDNDGDGAIDYPNDVGCTGYTDNDEYNAPPTTGPFNFTISVNPAFNNVIQGNSVDTIVTVTLTSGTTEQVNLSAGCPKYNTCTFTPKSGFPTYISTFTVVTTSTTPVTLYGIPITGKSSQLQKTVYYQMNVTASPTAVQCIDGIDNDNDGKRDYGIGAIDDPGCSSATDTTETSTAICDNGVDETTDADSLADYRLTSGDPGCVNLTDTSEVSGLCDDKLDNDGDGAIDYPSDMGCTGYTDNDETDPPAGGALWLPGVNLAGAEFGESNLPGTYGTDYIYPTSWEADYFAYKNMKIIRLPFRWERLQQTLNGNLDSAELTRMDNFVKYAVSKNMYVLLDPHNYARYYGNVVGSTAVPNSAFADFWTKLATKYKTEPKVIFGLMNEPHDMSTEQWVSAANAAIAGIRSTGATNKIFVPGNGWTGCHSWSQTWYGTSNAVAMKNIVDSGNNFAFECHQYLDSDSSGTSATCVSSTIGSERLQDFTAWARTNNYDAFLGEFAGADNTVCNAAADNMLDYTEANKDVWAGWSWWAAGPWWGGYMYSIEPTGCNQIDPATCVDKPQTNNVLDQGHLDGSTPSAAQCGDAIDNDNDGKIDYPLDPGCANLNDTTETTSAAVCDNGVDEATDADSLADFRLSGGDPGCTSVTGTSEVSGLCDDLLDNDADRFTDYPSDVGCTGYTDNDETDAPTSGSGTLDLRIVAGNDDVEEQQAGNIYSTSSDLEMMNDGSNIQRAIGLRYQLNVPRGSSILNAYLQFTVDEATSDATSLTIQAHDVGNSAAFGTSTNDVTNRVKTTASALWVPVVWSTVDESGANQRTANIKSVIQEVTDRTDWNANNYLTIIITGSGKRVARTYEVSSTKSALLHVEYGQACTPTCTSGQYCDAGVCKYVCSDGVDNDNDGKIDYGTGTTNDAGCSSSTDATETGTAICDNGVDETTDADTLADFRLSGGDPGCTSVTGTSEVSGLCDDLLDNDGDTFTDYPSDIGCTGYTDNDETNPPLCSDGIDNDNDGKIDFGTASTNDPGCSSSTDLLETSTAVCDNGADATNDRDTLADYRLTGGDPGCTSLTDTSEIDGMCDDSLDSTLDADTLADASDAGCFTTTDPDEIDGLCDDKIDNDADGKIDFGTATTNDADCSSYADGEAPGPNLLAPPANYKVAFIGDSAGGTNFRNVLTLIKNEGAKAVVMPGDLGYGDSPQTWEQGIIDILDPVGVTCVNDPTKKMFPFFISMGNHETGTLWTGAGNYRDIFKKRLDCVGAPYDYDVANGGTLDFLGTRSSLVWQNIFVTLTAPGESLGGSNEQKADYIKRKLNNTYLWDIVGFHRLMRAVQIGGKGDEHTYAAYDEARKAGAIIATAHEHSYERTWILSSFSGCSPYTDTTSSCPVVDNTDPLTIWNEVGGRTGQTFAFVSGAGGAGNRVQSRCLGTDSTPYTYPYGCNGEWASAMTTDDPTEDFGAFFIEFNVDGDPKKARAYFKTINGVIWENEPFVIINDAQ